MHGLIAMSLVVAWVSVVQAQSPAVFDRAQPGVWSSAGKYLWPGPTAVAFDWLDGSSRLRLGLEVPCHSSCTDMCRVAGYVVDVVGGAVIERLPEAAVLRGWKAVTGSRFRPD